MYRTWQPDWSILRFATMIVTGDIPDLKQPIVKSEESLRSTPEHHPDWTRRLDYHGQLTQERYRGLGDPSDIDAAIEIYRKVLDRSHNDDPNRSSYLHRLGAGHRDKYKLTPSKSLKVLSGIRPKTTRSGVPGSESWCRTIHRIQAPEEAHGLEAANGNFEEVAIITPHDDPDWTASLYNLGSAYNDKYRFTSDPADLDACTQRSQQAVDSTPDRHPHRAGPLENLGVAYRNRWLQAGDMSELYMSLRQFEAALPVTPDNHPDRRAAPP
ncbi:hypothetical protein CONLIGDRAFT_134173 [Coniochaeta ligniaria NRRL 30616]|uniref:TPR-like protein n=1 Tax=Coniochaeta ligniaria NRRL 30616 TaxID=1408157 RepID=A0A1J7J131_9PEZI|nr:hypothetical protein CONLIGDRAFT_134173 [Coniochaeta ligniaria NRRL 30616]